MSLVVDASVVVALIVSDERQEAARASLDGWLEAGEPLHAPGVLPHEVANVLARLAFDGAVHRDELGAIWADVAALGLILHPFDLVTDGPDVAAVTAQLRRRHATDSAYVCLARKLETVVWTLDRALARNAADQGLPVRMVA
jgi:predicted nucleic acid-binding protein